MADDKKDKNPYDKAYYDAFEEFETDGFQEWAWESGYFPANWTGAEMSLMMISLGLIFAVFFLTKSFLLAISPFLICFVLVLCNQYMRLKFGRKWLNYLFWVHISPKTGLPPLDGFIPFDHPGNKIKKVVLPYVYNPDYDPDRTSI